ncbi:hypothetical protein [Actinocrispum wychmicini]|uniref:hypothetical protein n=1 Tax=Actinocrispum wychmicini TaxID=1213861 RepID=UPI001A9F5E64|nr:hypothetical protein [Actinocrispum wychmicini]
MGVNDMGWHTLDPAGYVIPVEEFETGYDRLLAATTGPEYWAADGVHPTPAGHAALTAAWLRLVA